MEKDFAGRIQWEVITKCETGGTAGRTILDACSQSGRGLSIGKP